MQSPRAWLLVAGWIVFAALLTFAVYIYLRGMRGVDDVLTPHASGRVEVGAAMPDPPLTRLDGTRISLRAYVGHPLWVNFFATWCVPCKAELPEIERRYKARKGDGLVVLGLDQQEDAGLVRGFSEHFGLTYPIAIDDGAAAAVFQARTIPLSVFVDAAGTVREIRIGQMQPEAMDLALATILPRGQ
jgi:peroxiredoxin